MKKFLIPLLLMTTTVLAHDKFPVEKLDRRVKDLGVLESGWIEYWQMKVDKELYCWVDSEARIQMFLPQKAKENMLEVKRLKNNKWQIDITHLTKKVTIYEEIISKKYYYKIDKIIWIRN